MDFYKSTCLPVVMPMNSERDISLLPGLSRSFSESIIRLLYRKNERTK
jgi:hypothetical protein